MDNLRKGATAVVAAAALSLGGVTAASAANPRATHAPCSRQQAHLDKAQAKLDSLTTKFAAASAKVRKDRKVIASTQGSAKAQAKKALAAAKSEKVKVAKAKKAQLQRVAHAAAALHTCQSANPAATAGA